MGIKVEFNPDLALRAFNTVGKSAEQCLPIKLEKDKTYPFLKEGLRNYWLDDEIPLLETKGNEILSRPLASIIISESTHFKKDNKFFTKGFFKVVEVFDPASNKINFESYRRVK
jgi:hypothetical protein